MPRPRLKIGERGKTTHQKMEDGTWKAKASYRDVKGVNVGVRNESVTGSV